MRTKKQTAASRENGSKSHGAATPEGKARIVTASLWTGVFAETEVLTWEHQQDLQDLQKEYYARHPPASPEARCLLDQIITCEWHLRRFTYADNSLWDHFALAARITAPDADPAAISLQQGDHIFYRLQHRINSTRRAIHTALKELERLEARDQHVVILPAPASDASVTDSPASQLQILGSLRKNGPDTPAA